MHRPLEDLEALLISFQTGQWVPTDAELAAARQILAQGELSAVEIRTALHPARRTRSPFVVAMEKVAAVVDLPELHEDSSSRPELKAEVHLLLAQMTGAAGVPTQRPQRAP